MDSLFSQPLSYYPEPQPYYTDSLLNTAESVPTILLDQQLTPEQKALGLQLVLKADSMRGQGGLFSTTDLVRAGIGAGLGYGGALATGKVLGAVFGLDKDKQRILANIGLVGGLLRGTGVWR